MKRAERVIKTERKPSRTCYPALSKYFSQGFCGSLSGIIPLDRSSSHDLTDHNPQVKLLHFNSKMSQVSYESCPTSAPFFGFMGVTAALCFASKDICFDVAYNYNLP
jgi:hypothetical protein